MTGTINVDLTQLRATSAAVRIEVEQGLRPGIADADHKVQHGVRFGQSSPSGEADAARRALLATLQRHRENSSRHLATADRLTSVLDEVLANYIHADLSIGTDIRTMQAMLDAALPPAQVS